MALYRCAACGSPNVVTDQENNGIQYDYVKGAIGTVILGAGGAVAGITNNTQTVFKCRDCGISLSYPLGEPYKTLIDTGVSSMDGRQTLNINGFPMSWSTIKGKFPNIESGPADAEIEYATTRRSQNKKAAVEYLMSLWKKDNADDILFLNKSESELTAAQTEWKKSKKSLEEQKRKHLEGALAEKESRVHQLTASKEKDLDEVKARIAVAERESAQLQHQLSETSFFKFGEKSSLKKQIADNAASVAELKASLSKKIAEYNNKIKDAQQEVENIRRNLTQKLDVIYAPAESPKDRFARLKEEQSDLRWGRFPPKSTVFYYRKYFPHLLSYYGKACEKEVEDIFEAFFLEMTQLPSVLMSATCFSSSKRYYEPFLTVTFKGQVRDKYGLITQLGTAYYEYNGI